MPKPSDLAQRARRLAALNQAALAIAGGTCLPGSAAECQAPCRQVWLVQRGRDLVEDASNLLGPRRAVFLAKLLITAFELGGNNVPAGEGMHQVAVLAERHAPHRPMVGACLEARNGAKFRSFGQPNKSSG